MDALVLVDIQYDFIPGGALAVPQGEQVIEVANRLIPHFGMVIATQDWHPVDHLSFASQHPGKNIGDHIQLHGLDQILWPDHCVQGSRGAQFHEQLQLSGIQKIFPKGTNREIDSYSGFYDNGHLQSTGLGDYLREKQAERIFIMGLATDYCVKFSALDARAMGFETQIIVDGCRGVNLEANDSELAIRHMREAGVAVTTSSRVIHSRLQDAAS